MEKGYNHKKIEEHWQKVWNEQGLYKVSDSLKGKENFYQLVEFSYPSGNLHTGHWYAFAVPDIYARYKRMKGFNVLYPMGFDAFGLPAENAAIKLGADPKVWTYEQMNTMREQLRSMGASFDWDREVVSCDPEYYKWTQWMFNEFFKNDLVYRANTKVNWCPKDQTILANEQVLTHSTSSGQVSVCERCGTEVVQRDQDQWMIRITKYADRLIDDLDTLDWPDSIKESQKNWIGRSEGAEIDFAISEPEVFDYNTGPGDDAFREGEETVERNNMVVIIEHPDKEEFLCTKWKQVDWQGFVTGGIEEGQSVEQTALQEVIEETGYQNPKIVKVYDKSSHRLFWHVVKKQNRKANYRIVHVKLENLERKEPGDKEKEIADFLWIPKQEVNDFLKREDMKYPWRVVMGQDILSKISVFTTRPDTLFGVTYVVLAPEHKLVAELLDKIENKEEVQKYVEETKKKSSLDRQQNKNKTGVKLRGISAVNPAFAKSFGEATPENGGLIPVWIADYVLADYGTGAVMAVPAHDERDFEFAKKYDLPRKKVIFQEGIVEDSERSMEQAFTELGILSNSTERFEGLTSEQAKSKITEFVGGKMVNTYRLRDWGISRQRYWGCPIPIVYDPEGKAHPVPEKHLPWLLPTDVDHTPDGTAPLARSTELFERTEKIFGKGWKPEVETMDTFVDSSWYFYRYLDNKNDKTFADKKKMDAWMPIDLYMGGAEHTTMHLLYSRFWTKALYDLGLVKDTEAYKIRRNRGLILGPDGNKMSKSKGNVINPDEIVERLGADTVRMYLAFMGPYGTTANYPWDPNGVVGVRRFLERVWKIQDKVEEKKGEGIDKVIKKIGEDIEDHKYNTAISQMMILLNDWDTKETVAKSDYITLLQLLAPFAPHITEELWSNLGNKKSIHVSEWPEFDESKLIDDEMTIVIQVNGKVRGKMIVPSGLSQSEIESKAMEDEGVKKFVTDAPKKIIYVQNKLINIVI